MRMFQSSSVDRSLTRPAHLGRNFNFFFFASSRTTPGFTHVWRVWERLLHGTEPRAVTCSLQDICCSALNIFRPLRQFSRTMNQIHFERFATFCFSLFQASKDLLQRESHAHMPPPGRPVRMCLSSCQRSLITILLCLCMDVL